jgi:hypothetical protein
VVEPVRQDQAETVVAMVVRVLTGILSEHSMLVVVVVDQKAKVQAMVVMAVVPMEATQALLQMHQSIVAVVVAVEETLAHLATKRVVMVDPA